MASQELRHRAPSSIPAEEASAPAAEDVKSGGRSGVRYAVELVIGLAVLAVHAAFLYHMYEYYTATFDGAQASSRPPLPRPGVTLPEDVAPLPSLRDFVAMWTPIFVLSIVFEFVYSVLVGHNVYEANDTIGSMSLGMLMIMLKKIAFVSCSFAPYVYVWENHALFRGEWWQEGALAFFIMFVGVDFAYYWVHRTGHTVNAFWAMHKYYNLSTALRQSSIHSMVSSWYYVPLALFFPPQLFYLHSQFNLLYQFWIHTQFVPHLGPLEFILNTPMQHRVHHGRNAYCIDKNYGGTLSVFDILFGTFQEEVPEVPVVYGLTHSLNTFSPIEGNVANWRHILANTIDLPSWKHKFFVWYKGPGWVAGTDPHEEWPIPPCTTDTAIRYNPRQPTIVKVYMLIHFFAAIALQTAALDNIGAATDCASFNSALLSLAFVFISLLSFGYLSDRRVWCVAFEMARIIIGAVLALTSMSEVGGATAKYGPWGVAILVIFSLLLLLANHEALTRPIDPDTELGHDLPNAAEAQAEQLAAAPVKLKEQ